LQLIRANRYIFFTNPQKTTDANNRGINLAIWACDEII
jgi:hypothetical protein